MIWIKFLSELQDFLLFYHNKKNLAEGILASKMC